MSKKIEELLGKVFAPNCLPYRGIKKTIHIFNQIPPGKRGPNTSGLGQVRSFLEKCIVVKGRGQKFTTAPQILPMQAPTTGKSRAEPSDLSGGGLTTKHTIQIIAPFAKIKENPKHQMLISGEKENWLGAWVYAISEPEERFDQLFPSIEPSPKKKQEETLAQRLLRTKELLPVEYQDLLEGLLDNHNADSIADLLGFADALREGDEDAVINKATAGNLINRSLRLLETYSDEFSNAPEAQGAALSILNSKTKPDYVEFHRLALFGIEAVQYKTKDLLRKEICDIEYVSKHGLGVYEKNELDLTKTIEPFYLILPKPKKKPTLDEVLASEKTTRTVAEAFKRGLSSQKYYETRHGFLTAVIGAHLNEAELTALADNLWGVYSLEREKQAEEHKRKKRNKIRLPKSELYDTLAKFFTTIRYENWLATVCRDPEDKEELFYRILRLCSIEDIKTYIPLLTVEYKKNIAEGANEKYNFSKKDFLPLVDKERAAKVYTAEELEKMALRQPLEKLVSDAKKMGNILLKNKDDSFSKINFTTEHLPLLEASLTQGIIPDYYVTGKGKELLDQARDYTANSVDFTEIKEKVLYLIAALPLIDLERSGAKTKDLLFSLSLKKMPENKIQKNVSDELASIYDELTKALKCRTKEEVSELVKIHNENTEKQKYSKRYYSFWNGNYLCIRFGIPQTHLPAHHITFEKGRVVNPEYLLAEKKELAKCLPIKKCQIGGKSLVELCKQARTKGLDTLRENNILFDNQTYDNLDIIIRDSEFTEVHESLVNEMKKIHALMPSKQKAVLQKQNEPYNQRTVNQTLAPLDNYPILGRDQVRIMAKGGMNWGKEHGYKFDGKVWHKKLTPDEIQKHSKELSRLAGRQINFVQYKK